MLRRCQQMLRVEVPSSTNWFPAHIVQPRELALRWVVDVRFLEALLAQLGLLFALFLHFLEQGIIVGSRNMEIVKRGIDRFSRDTGFRRWFQR